MSDDSEQVERLDKEAFAAFAGRAEEGPVFMLNLLAFKEDGGRESYERYGEAVAPILERAGGRPIYAGRPAAALIGEHSWDLVIVVRYPTRQAFLEMITSPEYQAIAHLRTEGLARAELHPMDAVADPPG